MRFLAAMTCALTLGAACSDDQTPPITDDPDDPPVGAARDFSVRIENIAPWSLLKMSSQRAKTTLVEGNAGPGEAYEMRFSAGAGHTLTFATMLVESNDWFFAPEPAGIPLYVNGAPRSGDITSLVRLWNAGTEADQEPGVGDATGGRQATRDAGAPDANNQVRLVSDAVVLADGRTFTRPAISAMIRVTLTPGADRTFTLRIENVSTDTTLVTSAGTTGVRLSPVVWALHRGPNPLFEPGAPVRANGFEQLAEAGQVDPIVTALRFQRGLATPLSSGLAVVHRGDAPLFAVGAADYGLGLESLAEDGDPRPLHGALDGAPGVASMALFDAPAGFVGPAPAQAGQAFELTVRAEPGDRLSFATMFGASNDWFFAPRAEGIELFLGDDPRWGDITSEVRLYDLGTELDEELDVGPNTGPQQPAPDTGREDRILEVREVTLDRYETLPVRHLRVTLTPSIPAGE